MTVAFEISPARWPEDSEQARGLLKNYGQFLACRIGHEVEMGALPANLLLARAGKVAAGCVAIAERRLEDGRLAAEMKRLWVEPAFRGHGLGRTLIDAAIQWARSHQCAAVVLDTVQEAMPEAVALYQSVGFSETSRFNDNPIAGVRFYILELD
jgi:ribosomal protein S18 acetylase RimI-like enzyme